MLLVYYTVLIVSYTCLFWEVFVIILSLLLDKACGDHPLHDTALTFGL